MRTLQLAAIMILAGACSQENSGGPPASHVPPQATLMGKRPLHMRNCPSAIASARTITSPTSDGIDLTITSTDPAAREQIVKLAELQSRQGEPLRFLPEHSGQHTGPGTIGYCPIIHNGTIVTYKQIADGVTIHVAARWPHEVPLLQRATEARVSALAGPTS